jgi:hypothetical protein
MHEIGHVVGLMHTMARTDREQFVHVVDTTSDWAEWGPQYVIRTGTDYKELPTDRIPGANPLEKSKNFYKSIMLYFADEMMQPVYDFWAVDKNAPTSEEQALLTEFASIRYMGQRGGIMPFDAAAVNDAYSCFPVNLKDEYAAVFGAIGQSAMQVIKKIQQAKKSTVKYTAVRLFKTSVDDPANEVPLNFVLDNKDTQFIVSILDKCLKFKVANPEKQYELCVDMTWKLPRVKSNLAAFYKLNVFSFAKGVTALSDESKSLTDLGLANNDTVDIVLADGSISQWLSNVWSAITGIFD